MIQKMNITDIVFLSFDMITIDIKFSAHDTCACMLKAKYLIYFMVLLTFERTDNH